MKKFEMLCNEYRENKRMIEELEAINATIKADIIDIMDGEDTHIEGAAKATNKVIQSARLDSSALKAARPEIFNQYSKVTTYTRFTVI